MESVYRNEGITDLSKPYLSVQGIDRLGHTRLVQAAPSLKPHIHQGCMEIILMMDGIQQYSVDGREYAVRGGEGFATFLDQPHRSAAGFQDVGEWYWLVLNLSQPEDFLGQGKRISRDTVGRLLKIDRHVFRFDGFIKSLVKRVFDEFDRKGATPLAVASLAYLVQLILERIEAGDGSVQNRFQDLESYIEAHLLEDIRVGDLSAVCGLSVSTLQHKFKDCFGRTPAEYISYRKIQRAKELLLSGKSVTETAMLLDFNTSNYFSAVFRKFTSLSPSQWMAKKRAEATPSPRP